jgi:hypothetical protein
VKLGKWNSRKLFALIGTIVVGILYPPIIPLLKIAAPTYLSAQGAVDLVGALKGK